MASKYCSACIQKLPLSSFLANASADLGSKVFKTCIACRGKSKTKRKALQELHPNVPPKKRATTCTHPKPSILPPTPLKSRLEATIPPPAPLESRLEATIPPPNPPESRPETPIRVPTPPLIQPQTPGFLPADQWHFIQNFHAAMDKVKMETCIRCKERWFSMDLKDEIYHACFLQDKGNKTPFLM